MKLKREVKIGGFAILMIVLLYMGIRFVKGRDVFNTTNTFYAYYEQTAGIQKTSAIMIRGVRVGSVIDVRLNNPHSPMVEVVMNIKRSYRIPDDSKARIVSSGIIGGKVIEIEVGSTTASLRSGSTIESVADKGLLEIAGSEMEYFKQKATVIINQLTVTLQGINSLLEENSRAVAGSMRNIDAITGRVDRMLGDKQVQIGSIIDNLDSLSQALGTSRGKIENIASNIEQVTDSLQQANLGQMLNTMNSTLVSLNTVLNRINAGEGTVGQLATNPELYDSLTNACSNLSLLIEDVKNNPGQYVRFSLFGGGKNKKR